MANCSFYKFTTMFGLFAMLSAPVLNDVATTVSGYDKPEDEIVLEFQEASAKPYSPAVKAIIQKAYGSKLHPLVFPSSKISRSDLFEVVSAVAMKQGDWKLEKIMRQSKILQGVATTRIMRFQDDFVILVSERSTPRGSVSRVDMRSKSRMGKGDLGANAARIEHFLGQVRQAVAAKVGPL
ncbi:hypothetical protein QJQ45_015056 [Haematococcus lacustris]|nr:hypothetical protein QJQ45_015056 [Haematococcus lacustris]